MTTSVLERVYPGDQATMLTTNSGVANASFAAGFTSIRDVSMKVARAKATGLVAIHRLYRTRPSVNYFYTSDAAEISRARKSYGYVDQGVTFYGAPKSASCTVGVWSYFRNGVHRYVTLPADMAALSASGWKKERIRFYVAKAVTDTKFTIGVYPDTQQEVLHSSDKRFVQRSQYLVDNRKSLDLRFVAHTGDVVNWDTANHSQYAIAQAGLKPLDNAGIPYGLSIGNHDTQATGVGGAARDARRTRAFQRDTTVFNRYFNHQSTDLEGAFERGKVDNTYHVFTAGGAGWLVLNLELWPRAAVVTWAQQVVASHPKHNVIIETHSYLTSGGSMENCGNKPTRCEYGDSSPKYLYDHLVKMYPNVKLVLSGHVGTANYRVDTGVHGNRIYSLLLTMHSNTTDPLRLIEIDTKANTLSTWVYAPHTKHRYSNADLPRSTLTRVSMPWIK